MTTAKRKAIEPSRKMQLLKLPAARLQFRVQQENSHTVCPILIGRYDFGKDFVQRRPIRIEVVLSLLDKEAIMPSMRMAVCFDDHIPNNTLRAPPRSPCFKYRMHEFGGDVA